MFEIENLLETRGGIARLATVYAQVLADIASARKNGHLSGALSPPSDVKYAALDALRECSCRAIPPPDELVALFAELLGTPDENRRRARIKFPQRAAASIEAETGLRGRALAREMRARGIKVSDRSVARYAKAVPQKI
jgi:hypothetical protein